MALWAYALLGGGVSCAAGQAPIPALQSSRLISEKAAVRELLLDGEWQAGLDRHYDRVLHVPGLATDPTLPTASTLWYKRSVTLPAGQWTEATLTLKGARFAPEVWVNGAKVSSAEGGMTATVHRFPLPAGQAGQSMTLEIALRSLNELNKTDASAVPEADRWRNNVSSYLWDSVVLRLHGTGEILRITPTADIKADTVSLRWELTGAPQGGMQLSFKILDEEGMELVEADSGISRNVEGVAKVLLRHRILPWSPEHPHLYRLRIELKLNGEVVDATEQSFGVRAFVVDKLGFRLNGEPYPIRMGTVVWHRWSRDPEAKEIAFDPAWFESNVVKRLKDMGANALRFHLGLPPEQLLDLCDRDGLAVQMEWPFFHGISASQDSMRLQWRAWLDTAMRHPSVVIVHPWNETGGEQLKAARGVLDSLLTMYPPMVVAHRDLTPVHKYWWSLFENLGLYYDSAAQFGQAVMVDEFGGNYLDGNGDPGGYPATRETFLRFLGRNHTRDERLQLQADSNARVAEYWRRLGVAGLSPFCILGGPMDGNHWFLGPTNVPSPALKPVWTALSAAFAPTSVSLELWNRNFLPAETVHAPLWFFNDEGKRQTLRVSLHVVNLATGQDALSPGNFRATLEAHSSRSVSIDVPMPAVTGEWKVEARLESPASPPAGPVISAWQVRTFLPHVPAALQGARIGLPEEETELRSMLQQMQLRVVAPTDPSATVLVGSKATWDRLRLDPILLRSFEDWLHQGKSIVLLDAGPQPLGVGYVKAGVGGPLEGAPTVSNPAVLQEAALFGGVKVSFVETAEPESTLQQASESKALWQDVPRGATWLWNGLRGGLIVPAADMQVSGLSGKATIQLWQARGADPAKIAGDRYFAYELAGYYAYSNRGDDRAVSDALRKRVKFLVDDAPALEGVINPGAPIRVTDLAALYAQGAGGGQAESVTPLAEAGKDLGRTPVVRLTFGLGSGSVILSQLLTQGRLLPGHSETGAGVYGIRYDPVAVQIVLNMLGISLERR